MDVDFITSDVLEEESLEVDENPDNSVLDGERCGICMDIIIDRGVLDCCQHWFCFGCIDDWATITNLCPLCQNEFQSITCVPVYDTIGNNKVDEDSFSGHDDWSIEGNSSTLSFPSYYIDENAVTCLDGVGCKIRSGSSTIDDECNLDTSIACDSCDTWYHAACVGFDPEGSSEDTWLCPRCSVSDETSVQRPNNQYGAESSLGSYLNEAAFSRKVSVSVADAGETAIVVSMVKFEEPREKFYLAPKPDKDPKVDGVNSYSNSLTTEITKRTDLCHNMEAKELALSFSSDAFFNQESHPSALIQLNTEETANKASSFGRAENSLGNLSGGESGVNLHLGLSVGDSLIGESTLSDANEEAIRITCTKRKHAECSDNSLKTVDSEEASSENEGEALKKKIKGRENIQITTLKDQTSAVPCDDSQKCPTPVAVTKVINCNQSPKKEDVVSDVMSIVRGTGRRPSVGHEGGRNRKSATETENKAGLRVKKIMRRATDDKESSVVVQKLRKEIRDAVRNKSDVGEHLFDPKLLTAFRAAIAGSATEPVKKLPPAALKMKKSLLQKGKVRENLTKKIYGDSNGRRRRAWDRDCEVEFWKHRCMRASKPEKIATLSSVLNLLRKHPEGPEKEEASGCQERNPILSRLYLADTSVFPRKDNIKPLSALTATDNPEQNGALLGSTGESQKSSSDQALKFTEGNKAPTKLGVHSVYDKGLKDKILSLKANNHSRKAHPNRGLKGSVVAPLAGSKLNLPKETGTKCDDRKIDKRKWALEVLARKKAVGVNSAEHEKQEDNAMLKGGFPLLAQLPRDMRPELAPSRHNKIPFSVRQKQLYHLTEHFLRKLNLSEMRRTAATELAIADAINIEKEVADRSNSKQGYLNLCSHEILRRSDCCKSPMAQEPSSEAQSTIPAVSEQAGDKLSTDPDVIDALRIAGLLSDTPPNSPCVVPTEADETKMQMEEGPNNVFEIDSNEEVDIYGDFEYDLEDEDYIGATAMKVSKQPAKEGESKMKVLLTTLKSDGLNGNENSECSQSFEDMEKPADFAFLQKSHIDAEISGSAGEVGTDKSSVPPVTLRGEEGEEPSLAECEELYGPDKEPLVSKLPLCCQDESEVPTENNTHEENQNLVSSQAEHEVTVSVSHDSSDGDNTTHDSQAIEKVAGKDKSRDDISKLIDGNSVPKKVEAYIKEHIRPLCKSGIISAEQYRWAVAKTTDKVMKYHSNAKNANFLIKEGEKVKKLAEQYVEQAQQKGEK